MREKRRLYFLFLHSEGLNGEKSLRLRLRSKGKKIGKEILGI